MRDGESGLLFEPGNAADLADKIRRVWDSPALARQLGASARRHTETHFSLQSHFDGLMEVYAQARAEAAAGSAAAGAPTQSFQ